MDAPAPVFFERNRVARVYRGGKLFHDFFGDPAEDGFSPEEWIASTVRALNLGSRDPLEGISIVEHTGIPFTRYLQERTGALRGRDDLGVLVKVLDSAIRLPVQTHPDKAFSRKHFKSDHGKTEAWIVLATRGNATIHFGFKGPVTRSEFSEAVAASERERNALPSLLNEVPARAGDVYLIPPRVVHAIGEGCLILEVQEPTDFTLQPEAWCGDYRLSEYEKYLGLDPQVALGCFDLQDLVGEKAVQRGRMTPRVTRSTDALQIERLVSTEDTSDFAMNRCKLSHTSLQVGPGPAVFVVIEGTGGLEAAGATRVISKGSYFFLPADVSGATIETSSSLTLVECLPLSTTGAPSRRKE